MNVDFQYLSAAGESSNVMEKLDVSCPLQLMFGYKKQKHGVKSIVRMQNSKFLFKHLEKTKHPPALGGASGCSPVSFEGKASAVVLLLLCLGPCLGNFTSCSQ